MTKIWMTDLCVFILVHSRISFTILLQTLLNSITCRANLAFDHLDQLFTWFVYVYDSPLHFQQPPKLLRKHFSFKVKVPRCRECLCNGLRELGGVCGRQYHLNDGRRAYEVKFSISNDSRCLGEPHFLVDTIRAAVRATDVCGSAM